MVRWTGAARGCREAGRGSGARSCCTGGTSPAESIAVAETCTDEGRRPRNAVLVLAKELDVLLQNNPNKRYQTSRNTEDTSVVCRHGRSGFSPLIDHSPCRRKRTILFALPTSQLLCTSIGGELHCARADSL